MANMPGFRQAEGRDVHSPIENLKSKIHKKSLGIFFEKDYKSLFFEIADKFVRTVTQANVREPRENRGRLRHCNGLQTPTATDRSPLDREGGSEVRPEVRIPV